MPDEQTLRAPHYCMLYLPQAQYEPTEEKL